MIAGQDLNPGRPAEETEALVTETEHLVLIPKSDSFNMS
jgi:hypothetical protein